MTLGSTLIIYLGGVILLILFAIIVSLNFIRYRFEGDNTFSFIWFIAIMFVVVIGSTILLTRTSSPDTTTVPTSVFQ